MKISLGYPNEEEELGILSIYGQQTPLELLAAVVTLEEILKVQEEILKVKINQKVAQYIIKIAQESRRCNQIPLESVLGHFSHCKGSQSMGLLPIEIL